MLRADGARDEAVTCYRAAARLKPGHIEALSNLSGLLRAAGDLGASAAALQEALRADPSRPELHSNLGGVLQASGRLEEAVDCYKTALRLDATQGSVYSNLAGALTSQGRIEEAAASYHSALSLGGAGTAGIHSNLLLMLHYHLGDDASALFAEHMRWAKLHALQGSDLRRAYDNDRSTGRRLRIGYLSPDFRSHPVAELILPVLQAHDRAGFEVFCYSDTLEIDDFTRQMVSVADHWRDISRLGDEAAGNAIRSDAIDVLIDLAGHTGGNRLPMLATKPAPVQMTYLGYPNTTGVQAIDCRITDALADPPGLTEQYHTERLVRLEPCFLAYAAPPDAPPVAAPPPAGRVATFGSFNNLAKLSPQTIGLWSRVVAAVPNSQLMLKAKALSDDATRQRLTLQFQQAGVSPERLILNGWASSHSVHLTARTRR